MKVWKPIEDGVVSQSGNVVASLSNNGSLFSMTNGTDTQTLTFKTDVYRLCQLTKADDEATVPVEAIAILVHPRHDNYAEYAEAKTKVRAWLEQVKGGDSAGT